MIGIIKKIDWKLSISIALLMGAGLLSLLSSHSDYFYKQVWWIVIGLFITLIIILIDLRSFFQSKAVIYGVYLFTNALLLATLFFAPVIKGNRAWLIIGPLQFQPSELAKISLILLLSYYLSKKHIGIKKWSTIIISFFYSALPAALIALEPDLGSAMILMAIWFVYVLISGLPIKRLAVGLVIFSIVGVLMWTSFLKDYQKERIIGMFNPEKDPLGVNYNVIQSKIAIGSGGLLGKGFGQGSQVQLGFLPESHNDFIFSAIAEEGGLLASVVVVLAFSWMLTRILNIGYQADLNYHSFLCIGVCILFFVQFIFNVGSCLGMLPVVGVTLPFVSYGGSSIIANLILIGLVQAVVVRK